MPLTAGEKLGPYETISLIGKGGMGEVYAAHDARTGRDVAIKVSAERFNERFDREVRAVAALNHPNICTLFDVGPNYLVMELVEGPTLAERIKQGAIPLDESLDVARQIADALEAAHEKGITHRDLKPGNVKIKPDGTVKVLDFGLAKLGGTPTAQNDHSPTLTMGQTEAGVILGTAAYMSPEQAKGKPVDQRADIYAFGAVVYEMVTGKRLHHGETTTEVLASVIKEQPQWDRVPPQVRRLLLRCLEKDPLKRLRHIGDVMALIDGAPGAEAVAPAPPVARKQWLWPTIAALFVLATVALAAVHFRETPPVAYPVRLQIPVPEGMSFNAGTFALSPDGRRIAFGAGGADGMRRLWVRDLDSLELKVLPGTEIPAVTAPPFWSPDSKFLAFTVGGKVKKIEASGGPPQTICDTGAIGGAWNKDGVIIVGSNAGALTRCSASGGPASPMTVLAPGESAHRAPQFLPDGHHFLYTRTAATAEKTGVFVGSIDAKPAEQNMKPLMVTDRDGFYVPSEKGARGWFLFVRENTLMAQPFDPDRLELSGDPAPLAGSVGSYSPANHAFVSVSNANVLVYRGGATGGALQLTWLEEKGKAGTVGEPGDYRNPAVSPDGRRVAVAQLSAQGNRDIWVLDAVKGTSTRLTFDPAQDDDPVWSPDGGKIVFESNRAGHFDLYQKAADGSGEDQVLLKSDEDKRPLSWSRDGRYLLYHATAQKTGQDLWVLPLAEGDHKPFPFLRTDFIETAGQFSPDARWIAYRSNESGAGEIYVRPFSAKSGGESSAGGKWMVSRGGGFYPHWRADGKQLLYITQTGTVMAADVKSDKTFEAGVPRRLLDSGFTPGQNTLYDVTADGKRFLFALPQASSSTPAPFTVLMNWQAGLKK